GGSPGEVSDREHVAEIGDDLTAEADREPGRDDVLHRVDETAVAGHVGEAHRRRGRERAGDEQDQEVAPLESERRDDGPLPLPGGHVALGVQCSSAVIGCGSSIGNPVTTVLVPFTSYTTSIL